MQLEDINKNNFRTFIILWASQLLSSIGSEMTYFAVIIWAWKVTGQATSLSLLLFFNQIPKLATALFVGIFVDQWNRKILMIVGDTATGISTIAILLLFLTNNLEIWHIYLVAVIIGPFRHFQYFAFSTSISTLVPKQHHTRAVVMTEHVGEFTSNIIAPGLAGAVYYLIGLSGILSIDIITFVIALSATWLVHIPQPVVSETNQNNGKIWENLTFGWRYIIQDSGLLAILFFSVIFHFIDAVMMGIHSPLILARSSNDSNVFAIVQAAIGCGGLVGALFLSVWGGFKRRIHGLLLGTVVYYAVMIVFSLGNHPSVWMISGFVAAAFWPLIITSNQVIWLAKVPPNLQGRVLSTRYVLTLMASPIGLVIAGPLADNFFRPAMISGGILAPIFGNFFGTTSGSGLGVQYFLFSFLGVILGLSGYTWEKLKNSELPAPLLFHDTDFNEKRHNRYSMLYYASAIIFWITMASMQAWIMRYRFRSAGWLWIVVNAIGLIIGGFGAAGITLVLISVFNFDVLQNSGDAIAVLIIAAIIFIVIVSLFQWSVLRQRVPAPALWAVVNVVLGSITYFLLLSLNSDLVWNSVWVTVLVSMLAGITIGGLTGKVIDLFCTRRSA